MLMTSSKSAVSGKQSAPWRSPPPEGTTCCWSAHLVQGRRCWPDDCRKAPGFPVSELQLPVDNAGVSGPLNRSFGMEVTRARLKKPELAGPPDGETPDGVRGRVQAGPDIQLSRFSSPRVTNANANQ